LQKNVGDFDAFIRIWGGLLMLGLGITRDSAPLMVFGAGTVAEGITRFCPMLYVLGISTTEIPVKKTTNRVPLVREVRRSKNPQAQYENY